MKLKLISRGINKAAFDTDNGDVLLLFKNRSLLKDYEVSRKIAKSKMPWSKHEPNISKLGAANNYCWAVMEKFRLTSGFDLLGDLIIYLESELEKIIPVCEFSSRDLEHYISNFYEKDILLSSQKVLKAQLERAEFIRFKNKDDSVLFDISLDIAYKIFTGRGGDFSLDNLGFRKNGQVLFFDW